jgi:hypothetical protein
MHSRQYVAQGAAGCSVKGKTIVKFVLAMVFLFDELLRAERQSKHNYFQALRLTCTARRRK